MTRLKLDSARICIYFFLLITGLACSENTKHSDIQRNELDEIPDTLKLALDWSPNVLHAPLFWAEKHGYFEEAGISVDWFSTEIDNYKKKPIQRVLDGEVDLCIGPSEHLFFLALDSLGHPQAEAVATLLQGDQSCFVVKDKSGIRRPRDLEGRTYIGYNTPLEKEVLSAMIRHDGGNAEFGMITPGRLDVWEAFKQDKGDVAWVFSHWEATSAEHEGVEIHKFYPGDYGVPYGYSSVLMAHKERSRQLDEHIMTFLKVMDRSVEEMLQKADSVVAAQLCAHVDHPNFSDRAFVTAAWTDIKPAILANNEAWGIMQEQQWRDWIAWINSHGHKIGAIDSLPISGVFYENRLLVEGM